MIRGYLSYKTFCNPKQISIHFVESCDVFKYKVQTSNYTFGEGSKIMIQYAEDNLPYQDVQDYFYYFFFFLILYQQYSFLGYSIK